ncbi:repair protein Rad1/Rec1/Rad17-domain-containing protein [Aspergillus karnatakaensis]|uniref:putative DNA repair protein Rad1 n=1 Tax=Aspergillus karnatakaensis TaxID=1810916 RepID=UPI003CCE2D25
MSLNQAWEAASASPFTPIISKDSQFTVGFTLLLLAFILTGLFGLNRSFLSIASFGAPASLAFGFGAVFMIWPILVAVSSNAHQLYTLLNCISFAQNATVQITPDGIRFSVEEGRVVQGLAFLDKALFTTYTFNSPANSSNEDEATLNDLESDGSNYPCFVISLSALLETLKIFGVGESSATTASRAASVQPSTASASSAFNAPALLLNRSCTFHYPNHGSPLSITLAETGVKTICELTTYEPDEGNLDIPFQRDGIVMKIIMRSAWLHNAITELGATDPNILKISASAKQEPFFTLSGAGGPFSESSVEFSIEQGVQNNGMQSDTHRKILTSDGTARSRATRAKLAPTVTETFLVSPPSSMGSRIKQDYRFTFIQKASRAMAVANKVSIRGDRQGVMSLQFMIEFDALGSGAIGSSIRSAKNAPGSTVSFVDFRFVPLIDEDELGGQEIRDDFD